MARTEHDQKVFALAQMIGDGPEEKSISRTPNGRCQFVGAEVAVHQRANFLKLEFGAKGLTIRPFVPLRPRRVVRKQSLLEPKPASIADQLAFNQILNARISAIGYSLLSDPLRNGSERIEPQQIDVRNALGEKAIANNAIAGLAAPDMRMLLNRAA
ncbi:hypothetical protein [Rhizomicrobium palustre]|uniref:hypothetical protein n=1 Tax=Rhizomicrobium palustre TaxID=189966 RepID=UPI0031E29F1E